VHADPDHMHINGSCSITKVTLDQPGPNVETNNTFFSIASALTSPEVDGVVVASMRTTSIKFECRSICFKVFGSGHAFGRYKQSHSMADTVEPQ
jgi:hypothetical protein